MSLPPGELSTEKVINILVRDGWEVVRQQGGSHIQLARRVDDEVTRITIADHGTLSRQIIAKILKKAGMSVDRFNELR